MENPGVKVANKKTEGDRVVFFAKFIPIAVCALTLISGGGASGEVVLVEDGRAVCTIVAGGDDGFSFPFTMLYSTVHRALGSTSIVRESAEDMAEHLNRMGGIWDPARGVKVADDITEARTKYRILLGSAAVQEYGLHEEAAGISYPGYIYRVEGSDLLIFGSSSKGTANGVYGFLQDELGVRWFGPQELFKVVPREATVRISDLDKKVEPSFPGRLVHVEHAIEHPAALWGRRRMRMSESRDDGEPFRNASHNLRHIFRANRYYETNPEYYAMRSGRRQNALEIKNVGLCFSNPEVTDVAAEAALSFFRGGEHRHSFSLGINDGAAYCECPECSNLQPERYLRGRRVASDMYFHFVNGVARRVKMEFPDRHIGVIAYNDVTKPPLAEVEDNVFVVLVNDISEYYDASYRAQDEELVAAWEEKGIMMGLYYYSQLAKLAPAYFPRLLAEELKNKHARGYKHITVESGQGWPWHGPMAYVEKRLLWDVNLSVDELLDEYFTELYGPAAPYISQMYELFEEIHMRPRRGGFLYEHYNYRQFRPYTDRDLGSIRELIAGAHDAMEALPVSRGSREAAISGRLGYVTNGLNVFLDMLEGKVLAGKLEAMPDKIDDVTAIMALKNIRRANTLMERHERLYRETIILDENMPGRFTHDTARPVRNHWESMLSSAAGNALVSIYKGISAGSVLLDARVVEMLNEEIGLYCADTMRRYLFGVMTDAVGLGPNLVQNPGFEESWGEGRYADIPEGEEWKDGRPHGWGMSPHARQEDVCIDTVEHAPEHEEFGRRSARMKNVGRSGYLLRSGYGIKPGDALLCRAYAKLDLSEARVEAAPTVYMRIWWRHKEGGWIRRPAIVELNETDEWVKLEIVAIAPENAHGFAIFLIAEGLYDDPEVLFDNVSVQLIKD